MSLDVYLETGEDKIEDCPHCGGTGKINHGRETLYQANITHNLNTMAQEAGIYIACWRPEEAGLVKAKHLIPLLKEGLKKMKDEPERFKKFNAKNGWGLYENFVPWVRHYLMACEDNPEADVRVSR